MQEALERIKGYNPCKTEFDKLIEAESNNDLKEFTNVLRKNRGWLIQKGISSTISELSPELTGFQLDTLDFLIGYGYDPKEWHNLESDDVEDQGRIDWSDSNLRLYEDDFHEELEASLQELEETMEHVRKHIEESLASGKTKEEIHEEHCEDFELIAKLYAYYKAMKYLEHELPGYFALVREEELNEDWAEEYVTDCYHDTFKDMPDFIKYAIDWGKILDDLMDSWYEIEIFDRTFYYEER